MEKTVWEIVETLTDDKKKQFYYLIGWAVEHCKSPRKLADYKWLVKTLNEEQKKYLDWLIDEAIKNYKEKENGHKSNT